MVFKLFLLVFCSLAVLVMPGYAAEHKTPEVLGQLWIEAIKENSADKMRALIHPACPAGSVSPDMMERMVGGGLPPQYTIESKDMAQVEALKTVYQVVPEKQLNLEFVSESRADKVKYGLGKGFPIAKSGEEWFFVCLKTQGKDGHD